MTVSTAKIDDTLNIALSGRFDFDCHREFSNARESGLADAQVSRLKLDLRQVTYLDSSALGMLLLMREKAKLAGKSIDIETAPGTARDILGVANFGQLFTIV